MADLLSIVASITGLVATGTSLTTQVYQFIDSIRSASNDLQNLARELKELCSILQKLEKNFSNGVRHQELWVNLKDVLGSCMTKFLQLESLIKAHQIKTKDGWISRQWKRGKWVLRDKEVKSLRTQLEVHKATLKITLLLSTHTETTSIKDATDRIEGAVREVIDRLIGDGDGESTVARYPSNFILQRYLSSTASIFSSRPNSPTNIGRTNLGNVPEETERLKTQATTGRERMKSNAATKSTGIEMEANALPDQEAVVEQGQEPSKESEEAMIQAVLDEERARYEVISKDRAENFQKRLSQTLKAERKKTRIAVDRERARWESEGVGTGSLEGVQIKAIHH